MHLEEVTERGRQQEREGEAQESRGKVGKSKRDYLKDVKDDVAEAFGETKHRENSSAN